MATNRARLLFFFLAGVGVALLMRRRGVGAGLLLRRALFLAALGGALVIAGWGDLVFVFYGVLFCLATVLVRWSNRALLLLAPAVAAPGLLSLAIDPSADDTVTNVLLVLGEMVPLFCIGLVTGRADLTSRRVVRAMGGAGVLLAAPGLVILTLTGGLDVTQVEGRLEPVAALVSTVGLCLVVLAACLSLPTSRARTWAPLATAGSMPLSGYVGHALLFTVIARLTDLSLGQATVVACGYLLGLVVAASLWRRRLGSGPVEAVMRWVSGPRLPMTDETARPPSGT